MAVLGRRNNDYTVNAESKALQPQFVELWVHHSIAAPHDPCGSELARESANPDTLFGD